MWFTNMMRVVVRQIRKVFGYRVLSYIDDFLLALSPSTRTATQRDFNKAQVKVSGLLKRLRVERHLRNGCWDGAQRIDHLGMHVDMVSMKIFETSKKMDKMRMLEEKILLVFQRNQRLVPVSLTRSFYRVRVFVSLTLPLDRFNTRSIF